MKVSVSSLPYNDNIINELKNIEDSGADFLHLDVMDGSLTENTTIGFNEIKEINKKTSLFLDAHLMINEPQKMIDNFILSGVNLITIHYEAFKNKNDLIKTLKKIKENKILVGLSIYPKTKISEIEEFLCYTDLVLIMSVEIGKYGQSFIESSINKIEKLRRIYAGLIEVDGGVNLKNIQAILNAGADIVVVGGSYFNAKNKVEFIKELKSK